MKEGKDVFWGGMKKRRKKKKGRKANILGVGEERKKGEKMREVS